MTSEVGTLFDSYRRAVAEQVPVAVATIIAGPAGVGTKLLVSLDGRSEGNFEPADLAGAVTEDALRLLGDERADTVKYARPEGVYEVFFDVFPAHAQLIIVGATHAAAPLSHMAKMLGYRVVVTDARSAFARRDRFPDADAVLKGWPQDVLPTLEFDDATYVVLLSHDPKFDTPTLEYVLPTNAPYIGAIGSRKTQRERFQRLREQGYSEDQLRRIYGPVGLDLGSRSAEETALAILAEITAVRRNRPAGFLRDRQ